MFKTSRVKNNERIAQDLSKQLSETIILKASLDNDYGTYEELVLKLRQHYNSKTYDTIEIKEQELKSKIIALESLKLNIPNSDIIKDISIQFTIMLSFVSIFVSITKDFAKTDFNKMYMLFLYLILFFVGSILIVHISSKISLQQNRDNRCKLVAINIHKSVIEEQLNEIEENKKQNEKTENHGMIKRIINNFI